MRRAVIIAGPTASGKSGLALAVALAKNGTVINADSMQVYNALPVLTAQPTDADKQKIPHALYGVLPPANVCSAADWRNMAIAEIEKTLDAGRLPVITGGTGFYISALVDGLSPIPEIPDNVRDETRRYQAEIGTDALFAALQAKDPATAALIDRHNTQRVTRAWEVLTATGKGLSAWQAAPREGAPDDIQFITVTLIPPRDILYARCDTRLLQMIDGGVADEVKNFDATGLTLEKSLGYRDIRAWLDGAVTKEDAIASAQQATRNYAKRQMTWFRNQVTADIVLETPDARLVLDIF